LDKDGDKVVRFPNPLAIGSQLGNLTTDKSDGGSSACVKVVLTLEEVVEGIRRGTGRRRTLTRPVEAPASSRGRGGL